MVTIRARLLLATLWVGSLWAIGYIVAPTLFSTLDDKALAGTIAGSLFRVEAWVSIVCGTLLMLLVLRAKETFGARQHKHLLLVMGAMLLCTLVSHFGLQPMMAALRETAEVAGGVWAADAKARFGQLHGLSSGIYMVQSALGVILVLKLHHAR